MSPENKSNVETLLPEAETPEVETLPEVKTLLPQEVNNLIFGGGGAAGLAYAGVLWRLAQIPNFNFENVNFSAGTSIGCLASLAAVLMAKKLLSPEQMLEILASIDFNELKDSGPPWEMAKRFLWDQNHCLYKGNLIYKHVLQLLRIVTGRTDPQNITFRDLKNLGIPDFHIVACELVNSKPQATAVKEVFSFETTADACVGKAVRASTAAFPYFSYVEIDGHYYVDGGFKANVPAGIYDYYRYFEKIDDEDYKGYPSEMEDFKNRRHCIRTSKPVERVHNPQSLTFSIVDSHSTEPYPAGKITSTLRALVNGMLTNEDNSLNAEVNNRIEIPRKAKITDFAIDDAKQKEIILDGVRSVSQYFNFPHDKAYEDDLCLKIDAIKEKVRMQKKSTASASSKWASMWQRKENASNKAATVNQAEKYEKYRACY